MKLAVKVVGLVILCVLLVIGVPIIINEIYNIGGYVTNWGAADVLEYYGSVLGGFATLLAIYITIKRENKLTRAANAKQESERTRQMAIQRLNFVSSNLLFMLSKIDYSHVILNTFADSIDRWREEPHEIYRYFSETSSVIYINMAFTVEENEIIEDEFNELQEYAKAHSNLLWELYSLLVRYKSAKSISDTNKKMLDFIKEINDSRVNDAKRVTNEYAFMPIQKEQQLNAILQEIQKYGIEAREIIGDEEQKRKEMSEMLELIIGMKKRFEELNDEKYSSLFPALKRAEEKLKAKIEVAK